MTGMQLIVRPDLIRLVYLSFLYYWKIYYTHQRLRDVNQVREVRKEIGGGGGVRAKQREGKFKSQMSQVQSITLKHTFLPGLNGPKLLFQKTNYKELIQ